jgi:hypothetical protein
MENHTAKQFVLQLGSLASLYLSLSFLLVLIFGIINLAFPDAAEGVWAVESAAGQVRLGIAMTIVFLPTYIILTRLVNKSRRLNPEGSYLVLTKWLIYLSLLIGGAALLIDLVVVINTFLEGEITQRFVLKAASVLLVVGAAFYYYLLDARGHWLKNEKQSIGFGVAGAVIAVVFVILGFTSIEAPTTVREEKLDAVQISDLQNIQWQVQEYLTINGVLPATLADLPNGMLPTAPEDRAAYRYEITEKGFHLCATFTAASDASEMFFASPIMTTDNMTPMIINPDNWEHKEGEWCFERVVR